MTSRALTLLRWHHRRTLWTRSLWVAITGLSLGLYLPDNDAGLRLRAGVAAATVLLALLSRVWPRSSLRSSAQSLDAVMGSRNRLEAISELGTRGDPLAQALRGEADDFLSGTRLPRSILWLAGIVLCPLLLLANIALLLSGIQPRPGTKPAANPPTAAATAAPLAAPAPAALIPTPAALRWITPPEEISAGPAEEIPLSAEASSQDGLRRLSLLVILNGEARPPIAIADAVASGHQPISTALALEPLELMPFDTIGYRLQAERIAPSTATQDPGWPPVFSPLQFVQIAPLRNEPLGDTMSDGPAGRALDAVLRLKRGQFEVLRNAFLLADGVLPASDARWAESVRNLADRESEMAQGIGAIAPAENETPIPGMADPVARAKAESEHAATALAKGDPAKSTSAAGRALAQLATAEKVAAQAVREQRARRAATADEQPDTPRKDAELPARQSTPAGRLENLAARQKDFADQLAARSAGSDAFTVQDRLARELAKFSAEKALPDAINNGVKSAAESATEAARQLAEQDPIAAIEPATRAAQALTEAVASLESDSRTRAIDDLLAAQEALVRASTELETAPANEVADVARGAQHGLGSMRNKLRESALRQQRDGSGAAAEKLKELEKAIAESEVEKDLAHLGKPDDPLQKITAPKRKDEATRKLSELAQSAANQARSIDSQKKLETQATGELRRLQASLKRTADGLTGPLRWVEPEADFRAAPSETVALVAGADSWVGLTDFVLQLTVNGIPRSPVAVKAHHEPGVSSLPVSLPLAPLRLAFGDLVGCRLTAQSATAGAVSTPDRFISISPALRTGDGDVQPTDPKQENVRQELLTLFDQQREIVTRTLRLVEDQTDHKESAPEPVVCDLAMAEDAVVTSLLSLTTKAGVPPKLPEVLKEAKAAAAKFGEVQPVAAAPHAVRALAILSDLVRRSKSTTLSEQKPEKQNNEKRPDAKDSSKPPTKTEPHGQKERPADKDIPKQPTREQITQLYEKMKVEDQRFGPHQPQRVPPPPGPAANHRTLQNYAGLLAAKIDGVLRLAAPPTSEAARKQVLTIGSPGDAPPDYRPAVSDYFEALARGRTSAKPAKAP